MPKRDIHAALWPRYAVSDATLVSLIKELRRALKDKDSKKPILRTVHRVGYAFDAQLSDTAPRTDADCMLLVGDRCTRLTEGENLIGRDPDCAVWIGHPTVSRRHARITVDADHVTIEDLGSKNGTQVDEARLLERRELRDGDRIRFGDVDADFRDSPRSRQTATGYHHRVES